MKPRRLYEELRQKGFDFDQINIIMEWISDLPVDCEISDAIVKVDQFGISIRQAKEQDYVIEN